MTIVAITINLPQRIKYVWQILLLQRHRGHGNNERYIATNKIA